MKREDIVKNPKAGNIYHLELLDAVCGVWLFRFLPYPSKRSRLTGCDYCMQMSRSCDITYRSCHVGFIGYDNDVKVLRPANENEIAIFNRVFNL